MQSIKEQSDASLIMMTFDDVAGFIPYPMFLEEKVIDLKVATYMWYLGRFITHCFYNNELDIVHHIIGCETRVEAKLNPKGNSTLVTPDLDVSDNMRKLMSASQGDLSTYLEILEDLSVKLPEGLNYDAIKWTQQDPSETSIETIRTLIEAYKSSGEPLAVVSAKKNDKVPKDPPKPNDQEQILALEQKLIDENKKLKKLLEKNNAIRKQLQEEEKNIVEERKRIAEMRDQTKENEQPTSDEVVSYKTLYEEMKQRVSQLEKEVGDYGGINKELNQTAVLLNKQIKRFNEQHDDWFKSLDESSDVYQSLMKDIKSSYHMFPDYMTALGFGPLCQKILEIGGKKGPFIGRNFETPAEKTYFLVGLWNRHLVQEIVKTGNYDASATLFKNAKDVDQVIQSTVRSAISELGLTSDLNTKMAAIVDFLQKEKLASTSKSNQETALEDVSKPEASAKALLALESTSSRSTTEKESFDEEMARALLISKKMSQKGKLPFFH